MKIIKSLENRATLLKGTTRKITSQERGFLNVLTPLMAAGLSLMKSILTPLAKCVLLPFGLSATMLASQIKLLKKSSRIRIYNISNFKWRNERYNENS